MDDGCQYPVFFKWQKPFGEQRVKKVEAYFRIRRKSGGGECGPLICGAENIYCIKFRYEKDQQEVLRRAQHAVDGDLVLTVWNSPEALASSEPITSTAAAENPQSLPATPAPLSGEDCGLQSKDQPSDPQEEGTASEEELEIEPGPESRPAQLPPGEERVSVLAPAQPDAVSGSRDIEAESDTLSQYHPEGSPDQSPEWPDAGDGSPLSQALPPLSFAEGSALVDSYGLCDGLEVLLCQGDITQLEVDALVSAAGEDLDYREGTAAALVRAGGPAVQFEIDALRKHNGRIPTGEVVVTTGGNLTCKRLLHAVGPVGGEAGGRAKVLLERTVRRALDSAELSGFSSIALPCICSGAFGFAFCSEAVVAAVKEFGSQSSRSLRRIVLIDDRGEVIKAMREACDRTLQGRGTGNATESNGGQQLDAAGQDAERGAPGGAPGGSVHVEVVFGSIESQQVDALVSPMVHHNPLSTRIGNTLNTMVGPEMTSKFEEEGEDETIPSDSVLVEGLLGLPFSAVFFLNLSPWNDDEDGVPVSVLRVGINKILTSCDQRGFGSVAFPLLGAGLALRFPDTVVARVLLEEVSGFEQDRASSSPLLVRIVIHPGDDEAFEVFTSSQKTLNCTEEHKQQQDQENDTKRVILVGKTGSGKSSLANIIFEEELFATNHTPNSGTRTCQLETKCINERSITLIDTPGFFDSGRSEDEMKAEIMSCITECAPGPHAFLIVLRVDKYSKQEQEVVNKVQEYFSDAALQYAVIVFTHGDQLPKGVKIEEFVSQNDNLSSLVKRCGGRCHVFDNKYWQNTQQNNYRSNQFQLEALLQTVDEMVAARSGQYYTNEVLQSVEKRIQIHEQHIRQSSADLTALEVRKQARASVLNEFLIVLAGVATGALLGAFFGLVEHVKRAVKSPGEKRIPLLASGSSAVAAFVGGEVALAASLVPVAAMAAREGVKGGMTGHNAAKGAKSPMEAAKNAAVAVMNQNKEEKKVLSPFT